MPKIEFFVQKINGWILLNIQDYLGLIFDQEEKKFNKLRSIKGLPLTILDESDPVVSEPKHPEDNNFEMNLVSGNYIEIFLQQELNLKADKKKGSISIDNRNNDNQKSYETWARAKIISADAINQIFFLEYNEQVIVADEMAKIRPLKEAKPIKDDLILYYIKKVSASDYELFKKQYDKIEAVNDSKVLYQNYDIIKSALLCLCKNDNLNELTSLKELEERYTTNEDSNTNSEINSNRDSSRNIIGVSSTSHSGRSEESSEKNVTNKEDIELSNIDSYKYKESFSFKSVFKKEFEKNLSDIIKKSKYHISNVNTDEIKIIIFGDKENDFKEEKNIFENNYKKAEIKMELTMDKNEIKDIANKAKIKFIHYDKKNIYLIGEEKSISNFKAVINMNIKYSKEIRKNNKEKEVIQKKLVNLKKEYKINNIKSNK